MDELQSVGVGITLGLVLISILTRFPGEPFDYTNSSTASGAEAPAAPASSSALDDSSAESSAAISAARMDHQQSPEERERQIAEVVRMAQRVKVHKLQELLGMEKAKAQELVDGAKQEAIEAITAGGRSSGKYSGPGTSYGVWLDRMFFATMLALLMWVLQRDYDINVVSVATHLFPREAEATRQVVAIPQHLLRQLVALCG
ncbi:hypothetical protein BBJ28_00016393 [Nothophytophthora sp. Chile5]|nr:hypothetical protein BBJ28_00016393 [Nothophytophthora sp. Chile5]